jgi:hypothetical protein
MFGGKSTGAFVPVWNRVATSLAGDTPGLKVFGRRWNAIVWAVGLLGSLAFDGQPEEHERSGGEQNRTQGGQTDMGGGEGEGVVVDGGVWLRGVSYMGEGEKEEGRLLGGWHERTREKERMERIFKK